jgi:hypothetical protein
LQADPGDPHAIRQTMAKTVQQWSLQQRPAPAAPGGYEIDIHMNSVAVDTDKAATTWERIIVMHFFNQKPVASLLPLLEKIVDSHQKALAIKMLAASLRHGTLPPHPFRIAVSIDSQPLTFFAPPDFPPMPSATPSDLAQPVGRPPAPVQPPLSADARKTLEAQWRAELDAVRIPVVTTLDALTGVAATLHASTDQADAYLALADNYAQVLEPDKAVDATNSAAASLAAAYEAEHGFTARWGAWLKTTGYPVAICVLAFLWLLTREIWTKLVTHYTGSWLINRLNNGELAVALGVPAPRPRLILPANTKNDGPV